jgi:hypothetical protein
MIPRKEAWYGNYKNSWRDFIFFAYRSKNEIGHSIDIAGMLDDECECGVAPRVSKEVFKILHEMDSSSNNDTSVSVSTFQIYNDILWDWLADIEAVC